jgi:hypothetical protein
MVFVEDAERDAKGLMPVLRIVLGDAARRAYSYIGGNRDVFAEVIVSRIDLGLVTAAVREAKAGRIDPKPASGGVRMSIDHGDLDLDFDRCADVGNRLEPAPG